MFNTTNALSAAARRYWVVGGKYETLTFDRRGNGIRVRSIRAARRGRNLLAGIDRADSQPSRRAFHHRFGAVTGKTGLPERNASTRARSRPGTWICFSPMNGRINGARNVGPRIASGPLNTSLLTELTASRSVFGRNAMAVKRRRPQS
jgi:hypothetical protein